MISSLIKPLKKIILYLKFPIILLKKLFKRIIGNFNYLNDIKCKPIFRRNRLEIILDNPYSPEDGRDLLNIFLKIKNSFISNKNNIIIARNSSLNGYLSTIKNHLNLKSIPLCRDFNLLLLSLPKVSVIYSLDPSFSLFLFRDAPYLTKLRMSCQDELIIAVKSHISAIKDHNKKFDIKKDEIYYRDSYIRWFLHNAGFFEVLGPFTNFPEDHCIRSRLIGEEGCYTIISNKKIHPNFKGISIYRASTKTFFNYLENYANEA